MESTYQNQTYKKMRNPRYRLPNLISLQDNV